MNVALIYDTLQMDVGYPGYQNYCHSMGINNICMTSYYKHTDLIYTIADTF